MEEGVHAHQALCRAAVEETESLITHSVWGVVSDTPPPHTHTHVYTYVHAHKHPGRWRIRFKHLGVLTLTGSLLETMHLTLSHQGDI